MLNKLLVTFQDGPHAWVSLRRDFFLEWLQKRVISMRPEIISIYKVHHENVPCHTALMVREWNDRHNLAAMSCPLQPRRGCSWHFTFSSIEKEITEWTSFNLLGVCKRECVLSIQERLCWRRLADVCGLAGSL